MIQIIEVERGASGDVEKPIADISGSNGLAEFHAQVMCNALNRQVTIHSSRYYKVKICQTAQAADANIQEAA